MRRLSVHCLIYKISAKEYYSQLHENKGDVKMREGEKNINKY